MTRSLPYEIRHLAVSRRRAAWRRFTSRESVAVDGFKIAIDRKLMPSALLGTLFGADHEAAERAIIKRIIRSQDRVLEGGAGLGLTTLTIGRIIGAKNLLAYEPAQSTFAWLKRNLDLNGVAVEVRNRALSNRSGAGRFYVHANVISSSLFEREGTEATMVESDDIAEVIRAFRPTALVLDVEGAEAQLLSGLRLNVSVPQS